MAMLNNQMVIFRHTQIICIYYTVYIYVMYVYEENTVLTDRETPIMAFP